MGFNWNKPSDLRAELPIVAISVSPNATSKGYEIGNGQLLGQVEIDFFIFAENKFWRDQICDMIGRQNHNAYWLPNRGTMKVSASYPFDLDYRGARIDSPTEYPQIVAATGDGGFRWRQVFITKTVKQTMDYRDDLLYEGTVKATADIVL